MMSPQKKDDDVKFLSGRRARFRFQCKACGRCCGEYRIILGPYDIIRLKKATGCTSRELIRRGTVRITRAPFMKAFGFAPIADLFEIFGVSQSDSVPIAVMGSQGGVSGGSECEFLSAAKEDGKRLCKIYEDRPGMCRLHPLGCVTIGGRRRWFYRRPLCDANDGPEQTIAGWVRESRVRPFLTANARYLQWLQELLEQGENLRAIPKHQWQMLEQIFYDFDSIEANAGRITMSAIDRMFHEWLSQCGRGNR